MQCLGRGLWWLHTHTLFLIQPAWYFLALPASSIRLITQEKVEPTFHQRLIVQQEQRDTSAIYKKEKTGNKSKRTIRALKLHIPALSKRSRAEALAVIYYFF